MLTPDEQADLTNAIGPVRVLVLSMVALVVTMFVAPCVGVLMLVPASALLLVMGVRLYQMNRRRIAEGKTSLAVGRRGASASFNHGLNQAVAVFYMIVGAVIMGLTLTAPLRW